MPLFSLASAIRSFDTRVKIITCGLMGILTWQVPPTGLLAYAFAAALLVFCSGLLTKAKRPVLASYLSFVLFWAIMVFCLELAGGDISASHIMAAGIKSGLMALRLSILISLGLTLAFTASARQLGLSLAWFLRPLLGKSSWKTALSLALMIHFLPLVQQTFHQVRQSLMLRQPPRNSLQRFLLVPQATLRILGQKTWTQTVAVASRKLDHPEAWQTSMPHNLTHWLTGAAICSIAIAIRLYSPHL